MISRWASAPVVAAIFALGCGSNDATPDDVAAPPGPTVIVTDKGAVEGTQSDTTRAFLGIPYAAPPVGDLRWKPPTEATAWSATKPVQLNGHDCPQVDSVTGKPTGDLVEDCLFLNVWTPLAVPSKPAPVLVFIHGGGFVNGSGGGRTYDGTNIAATGAIVVTFNYRLGVFGFLEHSALAAEAKRPAAPSYGLLDPRAALEWVKKNAAAFGGDPNNVTLFGESAGAVSVCSHLAMPNSRGLFHRAIVQSGHCGPLAFNTPAVALAQGDAFAKAVGCTDLACMRGKSTTDVANALGVKRALFSTEGVSWSPTVDGAELPKVPNEAFAAAAATPVPVIIGTNKDEGNLFTYAWNITFGHDITEAEVLAVERTFYSEQQIKAIQTQYPVSNYASPLTWTQALLTEGLFICPSRQTARGLAAHGTPTYLYQFSYPFNPPLFANLGAAHSFELPFVFGTSLGGRDIGDEELPTSQAIMGYWTRFAATGDPNGAGATPWPRYDGASDRHLVLDSTQTTGTALKHDACEFWDKL